MRHLPRALRWSPAVLLLLAGCGTPTADNTVDINAAAEQAQDSIDNYADATATPTLAPVASTGPAAMPAATPSPGAAPTPTATEAPLDPPAPGTPGGLPDDRTPVSEAPFTPDSPQGAANVVQTYYALLGEKKYRQAWALWGHGGKDSGMSAEAFAASFDKYREYHANIGAPGQEDAGMSQRWVTVPVQVYARLKTGQPVYMLGSVQMHRVVKGVSADPADEKWRIRSADIKPRPRG